MEYNYNDAGHVMCVAMYGKGKVVVVCDDLEISLAERTETARRGVQEMLDIFARLEE